MSDATNAADVQSQGNEEEGLTNEADAVEASTTETSTEPEHATDTEASAEGTEGSEEGKKTEKKSGIQRRFQKYDQQLAQQAAELEYWKKVAIGETKAAQPAVVEKPKLADYDTVEDYVEAREQFLKKELLEQLERTAVAKTQQATAQTTYMQKVAAAKSELADWDEVMEEVADEPTSPETVSFCMESDIGPKIAYHLAKNPEYHDRLNAMSPMRRVAELGKLEERLTTKTAPVKPQSKAPAKLTDVSGGGTPVRLDPGAATSYAEWKKADNARKAAAARR